MTTTVLSDQKRQIKERKARMLAYFEDPETLDIICSHVANGGTVTTLAKAWDIRYSDLVRWIHADPVRNKQYSQALSDRNEWAMESVLHELRSIAMVDIRQLYKEDGSLLPVSEWSDDVSKAVAGVDVFEEWSGGKDKREQIGVTKKIKMNDKLKALELIGKNLAMFTDRNVTEHVIKLEDLVMASYQTKITREVKEPSDEE